MTLHFDYHPCWCSGENQSVESSLPVVSRWLWPGNRIFLKVASMVVTWYHSHFLRSGYLALTFQNWENIVRCFSIMNSLVIVLFLSGMVAMIMLRTLHKDIARYNQIDNSVSNATCFPSCRHVELGISFDPKWETHLLYVKSNVNIFKLWTDPVLIGACWKSINQKWKGVGI